MATFKERLSDYITDMKIQKQLLGVIFGKAPSTISGLLNGSAHPTVPGLFAVADELYLDTNWLQGRNVMSRWSPEIQELRLHLLAKAPQLQAVDDADAHARQVITWMQEYDARFQRDWFAAGMLGFTVEQYHEFMAGTLPLAEHQSARLCRFTNLPEAWLLTGNPRFLERPDLSEYTNLVLRIRAKQFTPAEAENALPAMERAILVDRQLRQQSGK